MPNQVTVTGKTGPGQTITTKLIPNVSKVEFDLNELMLRIYTGAPGPGMGTLAYEIGMDSFTSVACTPAGSGAATTFSFVIS